MTIRILFLLLLSWALFLGKMHCLGDLSPTKLLLPSAATRYGPSIELEDRHDHISHGFQSYFNLEKYQKKRAQPCKVMVEASGQPDMLNFQFQRNSSIPKCNFLKPLHSNHNGLNNLSPIVFDKLKKFAELLLKHNNLDSFNVTISQDSDLLETLKIDMNNLFILAHYIFRDIRDLKTITLNANNFTAIPINLFNHNKRLKSIELTQNKVNLTNLPLKLF